MGCSNRGGSECRRPRSGPEGPDGARMAVVAAAGSGFRLMGGASRATDSETAGCETEIRRDACQRLRMDAVEPRPRPRESSG